VPKVIAKLGDFQGIDDDGIAHGLLFRASPAFNSDGRTLYVTDLGNYISHWPEHLSPAINWPYTVPRTPATAPIIRRHRDKRGARTREIARPL
jgi:hypothetical protein